MRTPLIAANWKMNKTTGETREFIMELTPLLKDVTGVEVAIAPPFTSLPVAAKFIKGTNIKLCAQDLFWEDKGAYTGEISPLMIKDCECTYVITGHSERRQFFKETDDVVNKKLKAALRTGLSVIMCIGETLSEREDGKTMAVLEKQIRNGLSGVDNLSNVVIAYEPVWAIGTGRSATPEQIREAHSFIRKILQESYKDSNSVRILYGGSVTPENSGEILSIEDVDGALVGGASLKVESFIRIIKSKGVKR